jgi:TetR/AcrR family transcriptional regulator, regulator of cefoperazone and chloramphenicol sensitivity
MPSSRSEADTAPLAVGTRERLLDEAERLFAHGGVQGVTTRQIVEAADQRNPSAVSYHFGSRQNLLLAILARRGGPVDEERGRLRERAGPRPDAPSLVRCLVVPYAALLDFEGGRAYVQIVAQLRGRFAAWRIESDAATTKHLAQILDEIEGSPDASAAVRRERVVALIMVLTGTVAERSRRIEDGTGNELSHEAFVENLITMCAAVVAA